MTHLVEIHVNSVSGMSHITSLEYKHNYLTFIYSVYYMSTQLPSVMGSPLIPQSLPQPLYSGRNTRDSVQRR